MCSVTELALVAAGDIELGQQLFHRCTAQLVEQSHSGKQAYAAPFTDVCSQAVPFTTQM